MTTMMKRVALSVAGLVLGLCSVVANAGPAAAAECMFLIRFGQGASADCPRPAGTEDPSSDRTMSRPVSWWTYQNVDADTVSNMLSQHSARPTDLRVLTSSPLRFSVTMVANSGAYASSFWWYYGVSQAQVQALLSTNAARLISAVRYGTTYAVVMVPNTGTSYQAGGWCDTDFAGIGACLGGGKRLTNIVAYGPNKYVVIFVANPQGLAWCWWSGITRSQLESLCPGQSVIDISANPDGTFNAASVGQGDDRVTDFDTPADLVAFATMDPQDRPLFVTPYQVGATIRWITYFRSNH